MEPRSKTDSLVIHCSATPESMDIGVEKIREWHVDERGWEDVGYHYVIQRDGTIESARPEEMMGAHAVKANHRSIGICLIGGSNDAGDWENNFTSDQFVSLKALILNLQSKYKITYIIGHNEIEPKKECPSFNVQDWLEKENINVV
tara:strand:- start:443 stop:880 length:438 start_codon:yes stop_codon:yes gene_type:complete